MNWWAWIRMTVEKGTEVELNISWNGHEVCIVSISAIFSFDAFLLMLTDVTSLQIDCMVGQDGRSSWAHAFWGHTVLRQNGPG